MICVFFFTSPQKPLCNLCKSSLALIHIVYIPCENNHMFCEKCFDDSIEKRGLGCPSCNTPIPRKKAKDFCIPEGKRYTYNSNIVYFCDCIFRKEHEILKEVQIHCLDFFMELVSQCCFSHIAPDKPTNEFYKELLEIITDTEHENYKDLFPFEEECTHGCPIARSVLLQLLLEHK